MEEQKTKTSFLGYLTGLIDRFSGDKVILLIALFLMLISVISVFSSTPLLAIEQKTDRISIMVGQLKLVALGFLCIFALYGFGKVEWYKALSRWGFAVSFILLAILVFKLNFGFLKAGEINGARRILVIAGKHQVHIYEFIKIFMVMYLGWALDTYKEHKFTFLPMLARKFEKLAFLDRDSWQKLFYIYIPILLVTLMVSVGSNSSAIFIGGIMILMVLIGGLEVKDVAIVGAIIVVAFGCMFGAYKMGLLKETRLGTLVSRITNDDDATMRIMLSSEPHSQEWQKAKDALDQPVGALMAIKEGGVLGKGIGNSTQKYQVPVIFGDYMFSFIVEEAGLWGAIILILLYYSLLARGTLVAKECDKYYDKMIVTGLIILVTGQAFMHMAVNVHLPFVPQTGQTLPLVSHGTNSLLVFSIVFGILLSISKDAKENIERREAETEPIIVHDQDEWTQNTTVS